MRSLHTIVQRKHTMVVISKSSRDHCWDTMQAFWIRLRGKKMLALPVIAMNNYKAISDIAFMNILFITYLDKNFHQMSN